MKIQSLQAFLLSYPFERTIRLSYQGGSRSIFKRDALLIRVVFLIAFWFLKSDPRANDESSQCPIRRFVSSIVFARAVIFGS